MTRACLEDTEGLQPIGRAIFSSCGLFYQGREITYPGYRRAPVTCSGVNSRMCILVSAVLPGPTTPMRVVFDEFVIFNKLGEIASHHPQLHDSVTGGFGSTFTITTDIHVGQGVKPPHPPVPPMVRWICIRLEHLPRREHDPVACLCGFVVDPPKTADEAWLNLEPPTPPTLSLRERLAQWWRTSGPYSHWYTEWPVDPAHYDERHQ